MTCKISLRLFLKGCDGAATVTYVVLALPFLAMVFFAFEVASAYFLSLSLEHAAHRGARVAIVRAAAAEGVPTRNVKTSSGVFGRDCRDSSAPCVVPDPGEWVCSGSASVGEGGCEEAALLTIIAEMRRYTSLVERRFVTVTYEHTGLGYAGGPYIPRVTVSVRNPDREDGRIASPLAFTSLLNFLNDGSPLDLIPASAAVSGEDLRTTY